MNFFRRRQYRKVIQQVLHESKHAWNMRADIAAPEDLQALVNADTELRMKQKSHDESELDQALHKVAQFAAKVYPPRPFPRIRENVEIFAVAFAVAMAFRTYFIQPFKIPTGSMQPTLYGITVQQQSAPQPMDKFPLNLLALALRGEAYTEVTAKLSGQIDTHFAVDEEFFVFYVGGVPHKIRKGLAVYFSPGDYVAKGQLMASGRVSYGDHIFVDKVRYNFMRPKRGDVIVFSTDFINDPRIKTNTFYIKRLAVLPGEQVEIDPPYLVIDGNRITEPYPFKRLLNDSGYNGYTLARTQPGQTTFLAEAGETRHLAQDEFLPLGDNTSFSLDGRYFGPVKQKSLVGPAFMVYWPFSKRWGTVH